MINRKALWITILIVLAMIAANIWRASLLPDWRHVPAEVAGHIRIIPVFWTFLPPLEVLFMMGVFFAVSWKFGPKKASPKEAMQSWRRHQGLVLVFVAGTAALAEAYSLAHSLGALQFVDPPTFRHVISVATGIFMMAVGNMLPKMRVADGTLPSIPGNGTGNGASLKASLYSSLGCSLRRGCPRLALPFKMVVPASFGLSLMIVSVSLWHRAKVRHESSRPA